MRPFLLSLPLLGLALAGCAAYPTTTPATPPAPAPAIAAAAGRLTLTVAGLDDEGPGAVATLRVTLTGDRPLAVQAFDAADLAADGRGTLAFEALPPGPLAIVVEALDTAGASLGANMTTATIAAGQTAVAALTLTLPDLPAPNPHGALQAEVTIEDGDVVFGAAPFVPLPLPR